jgi:hypothetical protein
MLFPEEYIRDSNISNYEHTKKVDTDDEDELLSEAGFKRAPRKLPSDDEDDDTLKMVIDQDDIVVFEREDPLDEEMKEPSPFVTIENLNDSKPTSQQWRLEPKNRISTRPEGMPPAEPLPKNESKDSRSVMDDLYQEKDLPSYDARHRINKNRNNSNNNHRNYNGNNHRRSYKNNPYNNNQRQRQWQQQGNLERQRQWRQQQNGSGIFGRSIEYGSRQSMNIFSLSDSNPNSNGGLNLRTRSNLQSLLQPQLNNPIWEPQRENSSAETLNAIKLLLQQPQVSSIGSAMSTNNAIQSLLRPQPSQQGGLGNLLAGQQNPEDLDCMLQETLMNYSSKISPSERNVFQNILLYIMKLKTDVSTSARQGNISSQEMKALTTVLSMEHIKMLDQNFGNKYNMEIQREMANRTVSGALKIQCDRFILNYSPFYREELLCTDPPEWETTRPLWSVRMVQASKQASHQRQQTRR